jgi:hypothetical protein
MTRRARPLSDTTGELSGHVVTCPGCGNWHLFDKRWSFNGDLERPTFSPSMLVNANVPGAMRCHSFVTDGRIQFLGDCDHELKGQTIDLPPVD